MDVKVRHFLMGVWPIVGQGAKAGVNNTQLARHIADSANKTCDFLIRGFGRKIIHIDVGALRNNKNMNRRLRLNVPEGQCMVVFVNPVAGNLAAQNFGEDVIVVISHGRS